MIYGPYHQKFTECENDFSKIITYRKYLWRQLSYIVKNKCFFKIIKYVTPRPKLYFHRLKRFEKLVLEHGSINLKKQVYELQITKASFGN